jgi:hypothetical protein
MLDVVAQHEVRFPWNTSRERNYGVMAFDEYKSQDKVLLCINNSAFQYMRW